MPLSGSALFKNFRVKMGQFQFISALKNAGYAVCTINFPNHIDLLSLQQWKRKT